ncbi:MAG: 2Fe-2S iron-sulfur cluster binding domain-containing protein [Planctomycetales bacterium]|nr:2Fe-2S iron-sulfur cluster binding domain-containing protein [Planctomycetales bacterium]NIM09342.1 2Fe-2S iron-sulfur cluster binding domain-containing protein [Planctomycetales bacterium]NIN08809.1 2Fe-2S iron-sulfur cluster binding domain-containing protein [Planctomycetales bacterium]NIN77926.1 2Fe-2S iron-sulfur cluster binding domain-containing protein [Planctomycetales bacterium]NIO35109.1 2Fe-2S iron-sulfur cluster binding domain-containing protein [Planctomycetales bacterium]
MPTVTFTKEKKQIEVPHGTDLRSAAKKAGINVYDGLNGFGCQLNALVNCHGLGMCHTCRVSITKGKENVNPLTLREKIGFHIPIPPPPLPNPVPACLYYIGHEETLRLACMTKVQGDVEVETGPKLDLFGENFFS